MYRYLVYGTIGAMLGLLIGNMGVQLFFAWRFNTPAHANVCINGEEYGGQCPMCGGGGGWGSYATGIPCGEDPGAPAGPAQYGEPAGQAPSPPAYGNPGGDAPSPYGGW